TTKTIAINFGVLSGDYDFNEDGEMIATGPMVAFRGLFLIDKDGIVRHQLVNDMPLGRSIDEALRVVDALQFYEENGEVCPADWQKGDKAMKESHEGVADYLSAK
ncbi:MAG: peroxiredoxin, partial [Bacteroidia bacterium]|nr:peroxiredoxin [Bacteroidia bacterium]